MFGYYLDLALRSLRRSPGLTALMVLSIGIGVALAMTTWTLVRMMSHDPIPQKSAVLFFPTIDMWGPAARSSSANGNEPPDLLDYATAEALLRDHRTKLQSAVYYLTPTVTPTVAGEHPFNTNAFAVSGEFFPMVDVPFRYGSGWSDADDGNRAQVAVITAQLNDKVFGGGNSVGKTVRVEGHDFRVVGVMGDWNPQPSFFDVPAMGGFLLHPAELYLPFSTAIAEQIPHSGETDCFKSQTQPGFRGLQQSTCVWIGYMAQLDNAIAVQKYKAYLAGFARQHFSWPPNVRLRGLMAWLDFLQVMPTGFAILRLVGIGLLIVCMVDTIGLMLAKFLRRSGEIGVRRALGAPRRAIYAQFLIEGAVIGAAGSVLGLLLTLLGLAWMRMKAPRDWSFLTHIDATLLILTVVVTMVATLLAALYPTWRAAHIQPAWQLKEN